MTKRICIVTNEIFGPHKNGGIGTSQTFLALLLSSADFCVDILYTGEIKHRTEAHWISWYRARGISFKSLGECSLRVSPNFMAQSHNVFEYLFEKSYDIIIFQDWGGHGYATACAKRTGLIEGPTIVTWLHSPQVWLDFANQDRVGSIDHQYRCEMERAAVEMSDVILSPSQYMIDWLKDSGWNIPHAICLPLYIPNVQFSEDDLVANSTEVLQQEKGVEKRDSAQSQINEIIFFGRLETRKGIDVFVNAIKILLPHRNIENVTFLGKAATHTFESIKNSLGDTLNKANFSHLDNLNSSEAIKYILSKRCLVVVPSLADNSPCTIYECLNNKVPFITSSCGGMVELVTSADRSQFVCDPKASDIVKLISNFLDLTHETTYPRPRLDVDDIRASSIDFFSKLSGDGTICSSKAELDMAEDVTIVITHYERPHMLDGLLKSLANQTEKRFKVIIVDDASTSKEAKIKLKELAERSFGFALKILVADENRYLGAARNLGLRHVGTEYVIFIDDDNVAMPTMVADYRRAITVSASDVVTCIMVSFDGNLGVPRSDRKNYDHWGFCPAAMSLAAVRNVYGDATAIYRVDAIREVGGFHEEHGVTHEDWELHLRLSIAGKKHEYLPIPTFWYRGSADSMIRTTNRFRNDERQIRAWRKILPRNAQLVPTLLVGFERSILALEAENRELRDEIYVSKLKHYRDELSAAAQLKRISSCLNEPSVPAASKIMRYFLRTKI
jgi:glycosyltransferase involved in cell wall biosynthesis